LGTCTRRSASADNLISLLLAHELEGAEGHRITCRHDIRRLELRPDPRLRLISKTSGSPSNTPGMNTDIGSNVTMISSASYICRGSYWTAQRRVAGGGGAAADGRLLLLARRSTPRPENEEDTEGIEEDRDGAEVAAEYGVAADQPDCDDHRAPEDALHERVLARGATNVINCDYRRDLCRGMRSPCGPRSDHRARPDSRPDRAGRPA